LCASRLRSTQRCTLFPYTTLFRSFPDAREHFMSPRKRTSSRRGFVKTGSMLAGVASMFTGATVANTTDTSTRTSTLPTWKPDPSFYPSPRSAMDAPVETMGYVIQVNPKDNGEPDMIRAVDLDPE